MLDLVLKLCLAPALVVAVSLAGRRWGPRLAGILVVLPVVAGPILLIVYLEHGRDFTARAAAATTLGIAPLAGYAVVFALVSRRCRWLPSLAASWSTVLLADLALAQVRLPAVVALAVAVLALLAAGRLLARLSSPAPPTSRPPGWDLPARALATAVLVLLLTGLSAVLGPVWTGVLTPFPVALSVVCAFAVAHDGHAGLVACCAAWCRGCTDSPRSAAQSRSASPLGGGAAFGLATAIAVAYAVVLVRVRPRPAAPPGREPPSPGRPGAAVGPTAAGGVGLPPRDDLSAGTAP